VTWERVFGIGYDWGPYFLNGAFLFFALAALSAFALFRNGHRHTA
jgi:hypothetical protein